MRRISITVEKEILAEIDRIAGSKRSRSAFIDSVLTQYLKERARAERDARDLELINRHAEKLNREALDALEYQAPINEIPEE